MQVEGDIDTYEQDGFDDEDTQNQVVAQQPPSQKQDALDLGDEYEDDEEDDEEDEVDDVQ